MTSEDSESSRRRGGKEEVKNKSGKCAKFGCDFSRDNMTSDDSHIRDMTRENTTHDIKTREKKGKQ